MEQPYLHGTAAFPCKSPCKASFTWNSRIYMEWQPFHVNLNVKLRLYETGEACHVNLYVKLCLHETANVFTWNGSLSMQISCKATFTWNGHLVYMKLRLRGMPSHLIKLQRLRTSMALSSRALFGHRQIGLGGMRGAFTIK